MNYIFDNERPIYLQLVEKIRIEIISGKLKPGERIPSVRALALTERTNGKFVTDNKELIEKIKKELAQEKVNSFLKDMQNIGITYIEALKYLQELGGNE